jgi:alpha-mannosidase
LAAPDFRADEAARFGTACSQPLVAPAATRCRRACLRIQAPGCLVTAFKPSDDGQAWIVRLFGASGRDGTATVSGSGSSIGAVWLSDASEQPRERVSGPVAVPGWGLLTLRVDWPAVAALR